MDSEEKWEEESGKLTRYVIFACLSLSLLKTHWDVNLAVGMILERPEARARAEATDNCDFLGLDCVARMACSTPRRIPPTPQKKSAIRIVDIFAGILRI